MQIGRIYQPTASTTVPRQTSALLASTRPERLTEKAHRVTAPDGLTGTADTRDWLSRLGRRSVPHNVRRYGAGRDVRRSVGERPCPGTYATAGLQIEVPIVQCAGSKWRW